jgi:hypothetical protein
MNSPEPQATTLLRIFRNRALVFWMYFFALGFIPFRILLLNYSPVDDARRHVAKVVSGKAWEDVLILNERFVGFDQHHGWHVALGLLHRMGLGKEALLDVSVVLCFCALVWSGLFHFRKRPEAWILALIFVQISVYPQRWMLGRPFLISSAVFLQLLFIWESGKYRRLSRIVLTGVLVALACWIHGAWYLWAILPVSLFLAGRPRDALDASTAWILGAVVAGVLTGKPVTFLITQLDHLTLSLGSVQRTRMLVSEFYPVLSPFPLILAGLGYALQRHVGRSHRELCGSPVLWALVLGWTLGLHNGRFWNDWGGVALLVWSAQSFSLWLGERESEKLVLTFPHQGLLALAILFTFIADVDSRWSNQDFKPRLIPEEGEMLSGFPDPGGILYSDDMMVFYEAFFDNPHAPWRYVLGFESAIMPPEDLAIYRNIQFFGRGRPVVYAPWVEKMTPKDRLIVRGRPSVSPGFGGLAWIYVSENTWSGRLRETEEEPGNMVPDANASSRE